MCTFGKITTADTCNVITKFDLCNLITIQGPYLYTIPSNMVTNLDTCSSIIIVNLKKVSLYYLLVTFNHMGQPLVLLNQLIYVLEGVITVLDINLPISCIQWAWNLSIMVPRVSSHLIITAT